MNKFVGGKSAPNSDEFYGFQSPNVAASFSSFVEGHGTDGFMEGVPIPLPNAINNLDSIGSSLETMLHGYGGLLPFDSNKMVVAPPQLVGRVVETTRSPPPPPTGRVAHNCNPGEWMMTDQTGLSSNSRVSSQFSNELSLSLVVHGNSIHEQCSELSSSEHASCSDNNLSSSRFLLSGSIFLEAMQEILAGIAYYALENFENGVAFSYSSSHVSGRTATGLEADDFFGFQKQEKSLEAKKKHLLALLQMVDDQYSQCIDEIHTVTSAFHAVTELDPNLHARFALPSISLMYKNLRERICSHILATGACVRERENRENKSVEACFIQKQWALQQLSKRDHQLWRPQRGLPETSVSVLRTWMFQNFLHPYPKDSEKHLLALKSGLTRNQVSNWFINARVRLWKPMIEEMCAEMNRRKASRDDEDNEGSHRNHMHLESRRFTRDSHG